MDDKKPFWQSKTLILNMIAAMLIAFEGSSGILQPYLTVNFYTAVAVTLPVINALLRVVTTHGLKV